MKAVVIATSGDPQVLQVQEVENPEIGDDEVLIRVDTAAINQADTLQRKGLHPPSKAAVPTPVSNVLESSKLLERSSFDGRLAIRCVLFFLVEGMLKKWLFQLGKFFLSHWCFSEGCCWHS